MLVRHLCVLHVSFWCLEPCIFWFDCLLYAPWAQLRKGAQRPHYDNDDDDDDDDDNDDDDDYDDLLLFPSLS